MMTDTQNILQKKKYCYCVRRFNEGTLPTRLTATVLGNMMIDEFIGGHSVLEAQSVYVVYCPPICTLRRH